MSSWQFVQAASNFIDASAASLAAAFGSGVAKGDTIIVGATWDNSTATTITITDSLGTSFTQIGTTSNDTTNQQGSALFSGVASSAGADTVTMHASPAAAGFLRVVAAEYAGVGALVTSAQNVMQTATTAADNAKTPVATPTATGQLVVGLVGVNSASETYTAGTSPNAFTSRVSDASTTGGKLNIEDCASPSTSALAATWTLSVATTNSLTSYVAIFTPVPTPHPVIGGRNSYF